MPQTLSARLANLASRPNVQSTLILSRKDGSIIQATGLLAEEGESSTDLEAPSAPHNEPQTQAQALEPETASGVDIEPGDTKEADEDGEDKTPQPEDNPAPLKPKAYEPTHAEAVAAHIFAFISSASALSDVLSDPKAAQKKNATATAAATEVAANKNPSRADSAVRSLEEQTREREEESDVKLLRLRGKVHEIIIIPDRKYLLCVVQDLTVSQTGPTSTAK